MYSFQSFQDAHGAMADASQSSVLSKDFQAFQELLDGHGTLCLLNVPLLVEQLDFGDLPDVVSACHRLLVCQLALHELLDHLRFLALHFIDLPHSAYEDPGLLLDDSDLSQLHLVDRVADHLEIQLLGKQLAKVILHDHRIFLFSYFLSS